MGKPSKKDVVSICNSDNEVTPSVDEVCNIKYNDKRDLISASDKMLYGITPGRKKSLCACCSGSGSKLEVEPKKEELKEYENHGVSFDVNTEFLILQNDSSKPATPPKKRGRKRRKLLESNPVCDSKKLLEDSIAIPVWRLVDDYDMEVQVMEDEVDAEEPVDERILKRHSIHELEEKIRHNWENKPFIKKMQVQLRKLLAEVTVKNPKGRGRKPKKFLQSLQNYSKTTSITISSTSNGEPVIKRKRGRPRKFPKIDEVSQSLSLVSSSIETQSTCLVNTTTEEKTCELFEESSVVLTTMKVTSDTKVIEPTTNNITITIDSNQVLQKRKRGRPPKHPKLVRIPELEDKLDSHSPIHPNQSLTDLTSYNSTQISIDHSINKDLDPNLLNWRPFGVEQLTLVNVNESTLVNVNESTINESYFNENYFVNSLPIYNPPTLDMSIEQYIQLASAINQTLHENGNITSAPTPPSNSFTSTLPEVVPFTIELF